MMLVGQQFRVWSDCTDVQAELTLNWWQRLITFGSSKIRVNINSTRKKRDQPWKWCLNTEIFFSVENKTRCCLNTFLNEKNQQHFTMFQKYTDVNIILYLKNYVLYNLCKHKIGGKQ